MKSKPAQVVLKFRGFSSPKSSSYPDEAFDVVMPLCTSAQWKVLSYIMRRTFGFKKDDDDISLKQICHGITKKSGEVLDRGTGLSKTAVIEALYGRKDRKTKEISIPGLIELGVVVASRNQSRLGDPDPNTYHLRFIDEEALGEATEPQISKVPAREGSTPNVPPQYAKQTRVVRRAHYIQSNSLQASELQQSNSSKREKGRSLAKPTPIPERGGAFKAFSVIAREKIQGLVQDQAPSTHHLRVATRALKQADTSQHDHLDVGPSDVRIKPSQAQIGSARIADAVVQTCRNWGVSKVNSNISQIQRLFLRSGFDEQQFLDWFFFERSGVEERRRDGKNPVRNPMAYLVTSLKNKIGIQIIPQLNT